MFQIMNNFTSSMRNVVKNIGSEIVRECSKQGTTIIPEVASVVVVLMALHPEYGLELSSQNERARLEHFVKECVTKCIEKNNTSIHMLNVQVFFMTNPVIAERVFKKYHDPIDEKIQPLFKEIIEVHSPNRDEQDKLFKKIMIYINLVYLLGSPSNPKVMTETSNALKSVMSRGDLTDFFALRKKARIEQLNSIQEVVSGIRLFNKDAGHCGEGIRDIQQDLEHAYTNTKKSLNEKLERVAIRILHGKSALTNLIKVNVQTDTLTYTFAEDFRFSDLLYLRGYLMQTIQHEMYTKSLMESLKEVKIDIDTKLSEYRGVLDILHDIVQFRVAVPTERVFPHFSKLANLWHGMITCIYMLIEINKINERLTMMDDTREFDTLIGKLDKQGYLEVDFKETPYAIYTLATELQRSQFEYVSPQSSEASNPTMVSRYCIYTYIVTKGLLFPGKTNAGYIKYNNLLLSFLSAECAKKFLSNIDHYFDDFIDLLRRRPGTVALFDLYDIVISYKSPIVKVDLKEVIHGRNDCEVQTDLHPIPYRKHKDYTWNVWDLRQKAIKLANLKNCRTHSAQTEWSYHRLNVNLQTADPKENQCQTKCDAYTNFAKKDASTDCADEEKKIDARAMAKSGIRCTVPLKDYYIVPYRLYGVEKIPEENDAAMCLNK